MCHCLMFADKHHVYNRASEILRSNSPSYLWLHVQLILVHIANSSLHLTLAPLTVAFRIGGHLPFIAYALSAQQKYSILDPGQVPEIRGVTRSDRMKNFLV